MTISINGKEKFVRFTDL